jgi:hypothetical protein
MSNSTNGLNSNDLVFYKEGESVMSGGYKLNSIFLQNGVPPMQTNNVNNTKKRNKGLESEPDSDSEKTPSLDKEVSSLFNDLVIPVGLFLNNSKLFPKNKVPFNKYEEHTMISDDIFDKLFNMVEYDSKKNKFSKTKKMKNDFKMNFKKALTKKSRK